MSFTVTTLVSPAKSPQRTQAEQFRKEHQDYFFDDAHYLVEASASASAKEIAHNVFEFSDGSVLRIASSQFLVQAYASHAELLAAIEQGLPGRLGDKAALASMRE